MHDLKRQNQKKVKQNRRKQQKKPREWRRLLQTLLRLTVAAGSGFLFACGAVLTGQMLFESGYFNVQQVRVEHHARVSEGDILEASDIETGDSLFDLDLQMIGGKIEENPWIAEAEVVRVFPDQVVIRVIERQPRAIVDLGYLYYVDEEASVFKLLDQGDELDFPVVTGIDREALLEDRQEARSSLELALQLMRSLEKRRLFNLEAVSEIHYDAQEGLIVFTYVGGVPVHMGKQGFAAKLERLEQIYPDLEPRLEALAYIDLNVTDRVIVKIDVKRSVGRS